MLMFEFSPYAVPSFIAGIFAAILAVLAWNRRSVPGGTTFTLLVIGVSEWLLGEAFEHLTPTLSGKVFWTNIQYLGIISVPVLLFFFVLQYTNYDQAIKRHNQLWFLLYPVIMNLIIWTNPSHHLFTESAWLNTSGIYPLLDVTRGPLFWVHMAAGYMLLLVSTVMLMVAYNGSSGFCRKQTQLLLISTLLPWITNLAYITDIALTLDLTPFAFTVSLIIMYIALQRYGFLEIVPIARDMVVENLSDLVIVLDAKNRIIDLNRSARQKMDLVGVSVIGKYAQEAVPHYQTIFNQDGEQHEAHNHIEIVVDGEIVIMDVQITPLYDRRLRFTGRIFNLRDITTLKRAEQTLLANERALRAYARELEEQNEELDAFAHTVAHDLKQPLGILLGYSTFLTDSLGTLDQEMLTHSTLMIEKNTRKMSSIVNELLLFASVRKKDTVEIKPIAMGEVVSSVISRLDDLIVRTKAHVIVPVAWPRALGYASWIEEIWVNLITNAIKYGGTPPYVILAAEPMLLTEGNHKGSWVRFSVTDNGTGLSEEAQERLFMPFERLGQVKFEGSGLGLSIVQRIARRLGGWIGVESVEIQEPNTPSTAGSGNIFYFVLPATRTSPSD